MSLRHALKREHLFDDLAAGVELVPFPNPLQTEFVRSLLDRSSRASFGEKVARETASVEYWRE